MAYSKALSIETVIEQLQQVLHNLTDLSEFRAQRPFEGVTFESIPLYYRERSDPTFWRILIVPANQEFEERSAVLQADPVDS